MASPVPAKSQPLHNFDLPRTFKWNKDGKTSNHPQRRRSVKSPSRRPNPSPLRHESPLREFSLEKESSGVIEYRRSHNYQTKKGKGTEEMNRSSKILIKIPFKSNKSEGEENLDVKLEQEEDEEVPNQVSEHDQEKEKGEINNQNNNSSERDEKDEKDEEAKTWNLRPRKPLRRSLNVNGVVKSCVNDKGRANESKNPNSRGGEGEGTGYGDKEKRKLGCSVSGYGGGVEKEKRKFSINISLTKDEIEEDIFAFTGSKPARRPRKRNKTAQKHVDYVFPGLWLVGISVDSYKVSESSMKG